MVAALPGGEPERLLCPITRVMLQDPVFNEAGNTYERTAIVELWQRREDFFDPLFNRVLRDGVLRPNWDKRREVQEFLAEHRTYIPEGWDTRDVPPVPAADDKVVGEDLPTWAWLITVCPKRRSMRVMIMAVGSIAGAIGSLIVEFTCLSEAMGSVWPCSQLDGFLHSFSPWVVAPLSVVVGGLLFGATFGALCATGIVVYIFLTWLLQLCPSLICCALTWRRGGREAAARAHAEAQRRSQARLLQAAELEAQTRARNQATLEYAAQSQAQQSR